MIYKWRGRIVCKKHTWDEEVELSEKWRSTHWLHECRDNRISIGLAKRIAEEYERLGIDPPESKYYFVDVDVSWVSIVIALSTKEGLDGFKDKDIGYVFEAYDAMEMGKICLDLLKEGHETDI